MGWAPRRVGGATARGERAAWLGAACGSRFDDETQRLGREQLLEELDGLEVADDQVAEHAAHGGAGPATVLAAADGPQDRDVGDDAPVGLVLVEDAEADPSGSSGRVVTVVPPCIAMVVAGWDVSHEPLGITGGAASSFP